MGLKDLSVEDIQKLQELLKLLAIFGITEEDLRNLHDYINKKETRAYAPTSEDDKTIQEKNEKASHNKSTFEDYVNMFTGETEDFYPDGRQQQ